MWDTIKNELQLLCARKSYCASGSELEEAVTIFLLAVALVYGAAREIITRKLDGKSSELYVLRDDIFDIVLCRIFGILLLGFVSATWIFYYETAQIDVLLYEVILALTALSVNNNKCGLLFVALSYSSWYGWFRLLMVTPLGNDYHILIQPQWLAALTAFTSPTLAANLKYPALIETKVARVAYGLVFFGVLVAMNASFLLCDALAIYYDLLPNYASKVSQGLYFRLYGMNMNMRTRMGYFLAMLVLQYITCKMPHLMLNEDALHEQLRDQDAALVEEQKQARLQRRNAIRKENQFSSVHNSAHAEAGSAGSTSEVPLEVPDIDFTDMPEDCVEITAEAAIELQERLIRDRTVKS